MLFGLGPGTRGTVDGSEIWLTSWYGLNPIVCRVSYILDYVGWLAGFLNHQQTFLQNYHAYAACLIPSKQGVSFIYDTCNWISWIFILWFESYQDGQDDTLPPSSRYGLGGALALRFAQDFHVVLFGRRSETKLGDERCWLGQVVRLI